MAKRKKSEMSKSAKMYFDGDATYHSYSEYTKKPAATKKVKAKQKKVERGNIAEVIREKNRRTSEY